MRIALLTIALVLLSACTSKTEFGPCVGVTDDKDPKLTYKVSVWNAALGVIFSEMILPPILVLANETYCPIATTRESK